MRCRDIANNLEAWLDGELPDDQATASAQHCATCAHCQAAVQVRQREKQQWRQALQGAAPAGLRREILANRATVRRLPRWPLLAAAAALVALLVTPRLLNEPATTGFREPCTLQQLDTDLSHERTLVLPGGLL